MTISKSDEISWEHEQNVTEAMEKMDEIFSQIEKVQETMQKIEQQVEKKKTQRIYHGN